MAKHTVVWIDHKEARIFGVESGAATELTVHAPHSVHRHPRESDRAKDYPDETRRFFQEVASALADTQGIILVGPSSAKLELFKYVHAHDHVLAPKIIGIETMDHPTDKQIVAYARQYFGLGEPTPTP